MVYIVFLGAKNVIHQLDQTQFGRTSALFTGIAAYQLSGASVIDGSMPGNIWVDDVESPQSGYMESPEGMFLAGEPGNRAFNCALNEYFRTNLFDVADAITSVWLTYYPPGWGDKLMGLLYPRDLLICPRRHYVCHQLAVDWRARLPEGFSVRRIDADLLAHDQLTIPDHVNDWVMDNWRSVENYMAHGFGFCTIHDQEKRIVSWSLADCVHGEGCEIGIQTLPEYRRRGLATITAAAAVDHALTNGYAWVGWHCNDDNLGSRGVAEHVGFELERHYVTTYAMFNAWDHWAERGWQAFRAGNITATVDCYERVFALRSDVPHYYYALAARANAAAERSDRALRYLREAIDRGPIAPEYLSETPEFESVRDRPEWAVLFDRVRTGR
jgi:RimJ/RimL family protein N-acetyltransferase